MLLSKITDPAVTTKKYFETGPQVSTLLRKLFATTEGEIYKTNSIKDILYKYVNM